VFVACSACPCLVSWLLAVRSWPFAFAPITSLQAWVCWPGCAAHPRLQACVLKAHTVSACDTCLTICLLSCLVCCPALLCNALPSCCACIYCHFACPAAVFLLCHCCAVSSLHINSLAAAHCSWHGSITQDQYEIEADEGSQAYPDVTYNQVCILGGGGCTCKGWAVRSAGSECWCKGPALRFQPLHNVRPGAQVSQCRCSAQGCGL
jgi:hypothetical protein